MAQSTRVIPAEIRTRLTSLQDELGLAGITIEKLFDLMLTYTATPFGSFVSSWLLIDVLDKVGFFGKAVGPGTYTQKDNPTEYYLLTGLVQGLKGNPALSLFGQLLSLAITPGPDPNNPSIVVAVPVGSAEAATLKTLLASAEVIQSLGGLGQIGSFVSKLTGAAK